MRIGIDFGTTRIVVAAVDRGNYPVLTFEGPDGAARDWFPPLVAARGHERRYGFDAWAVAGAEGWTVVRSVKHLLGASGLDTRVDVGGAVPVPMMTVLRELAAAVRKALIEKSSLQARPDEPIEAMLGVPANAHSNQRFLTAEAFRAAGFRVIGLLNEPSAASIELGHRSRLAGEGEARRAMLVYDFGGGTFDASLVELDEQVHWVRASEGLSTLGGDDFDEILADLALDAAGIGDRDRDRLSQAEWFALHDVCRLHKEALHANARRIVIDLDEVVSGWPTVTIPVAAFYERCEPLVARTIDTVDRLLVHQAITSGGDAAGFDALFMIGGSSELPIVGRRLRERYGRRVKRSAHPRSATAIGLAIQADIEAGYVLRDRFTRYFGVCGARATVAPRRSSTRSSRKACCCPGLATCRWRPRAPTTRPTTSGTSASSSAVTWPPTAVRPATSRCGTRSASRSSRRWPRRAISRAWRSCTISRRRGSRSRRRARWRRAGP